jgi:hypothetical protein
MYGVCAMSTLPQSVAELAIHIYASRRLMSALHALPCCPALLPCPEYTALPTCHLRCMSNKLIFLIYRLSGLYMCPHPAAHTAGTAGSIRQHLTCLAYHQSAHPSSQKPPTRIIQARRKQEKQQWQKKMRLSQKVGHTQRWHQIISTTSLSTPHR